MCYLNKLRFLKLKFGAFFVLTLFIGLAFNAYFGRHTISFCKTEVFTKSEKAELLGKRVFDTCLKTPVNGTITDFNGFGIEITYDQPIYKTYKKFSSDKYTFEKCKVLTD